RAPHSPHRPGATRTRNPAPDSSSTSYLKSKKNPATATTAWSSVAAAPALTKSGPATVVAGSNLTYTLTVSNNGPSAAQGVSLARSEERRVGKEWRSQTAGPDSLKLGRNGNQITDTIAT